MIISTFVASLHLFRFNFKLNIENKTAVAVEWQQIFKITLTKLFTCSKFDRRIWESAYCPQTNDVIVFLLVLSVILQNSPVFHKNWRLIRTVINYSSNTFRRLSISQPRSLIIRSILLESKVFPCWTLHLSSRLQTRRCRPRSRGGPLPAPDCRWGSPGISPLHSCSRMSPGQTVCPPSSLLQSSHCVTVSQVACRSPSYSLTSGSS